MWIILVFLGIFFLITITLLAGMLFRYYKKNKFYIFCQYGNCFYDTEMETINNYQVILLKKKETVFGRDKNVDVKIKDMKISNLHFVISLEEGRCYISDCGSSNGTFVNGNRIQKHELFPNDIILAGETSMKIGVVKK